MAYNHIVGGPFWSKFELLLDNMHPLYTYKFKKDRMNSNKWQYQFLDAQGQLTLYSVIRSDPSSNSSTLLCMSPLPGSMKRIRYKTAEKTWQPHFKYTGIFFRHSRADNSQVHGPILSNFELLLDIMHVLDTF